MVVPPVNPGTKPTVDERLAIRRRGSARLAANPRSPSVPRDYAPVTNAPGITEPNPGTFWQSDGNPTSGAPTSTVTPIPAAVPTLTAVPNLPTATALPTAPTLPTALVLTPALTPPAAPAAPATVSQAGNQAAAPDRVKDEGKASVQSQQPLAADGRGSKRVKLEEDGDAHFTVNELKTILKPLADAQEATGSAGPSAPKSSGIPAVAQSITSDPPPLSSLAAKNKQEATSTTAKQTPEHTYEPAKIRPISPVHWDTETPRRRGSPVMEPGLEVMDSP